MEDIHHHHNNIPKKDMDRTCMKGSFPIDSITASEGIIEYIEESKLLNHNKVVFSDHRSYIVDFNIQEYFNE